MNKHKPIHSINIIYIELNSDKIEKNQHKEKVSDSSSEDDSEQFREVDCNQFFFSEEEDYSV